MKVKIFKKFLNVCLMILITSVFLTGCGEQSVEKKDVKMATGDISGTYYPIGNAMAEILNKNIKTINVSTESTKGSIENIEKLNNGSADLAIIQNDIAYYAANGAEMFANNKVDNIRALASLYPETCQFVTFESSGINNIDELHGKKIAVGIKGSGAEANARQILEAYGITYNDIDAQYLSFTEGKEALKEGKVDCAFVIAGYPTKAVQDIAVQQKIRILSITNDKASILSSLYPYYTRITIPKGSYDGIDEDVSSIAVRAMFVCTDKLDEQTGSEIVKIIFNNKEDIEKAHSVGQFFKTENATKGMSIKMNAGAERYLRDFSNFK